MSSNNFSRGDFINLGIASGISSFNTNLFAEQTTSSSPKTVSHKGLLYYYHPDFLKHDTGRHHPERPERLQSINLVLKEMIDNKTLQQFTPTQSKLKNVLLCHGKDYIDSVLEDIKKGKPRLSTGDTSISGLPSLNAALLAVGAGTQAVDAIMQGKHKRAFVACRPPGHHACPNKGMGFCIFNNIGIAARYAQKNYGLERVLIIDWDVHHGNGTQDIFYDDPSVFFFSSHQWPQYPGTGAEKETGSGKAIGTTMNRTFPANSGRKEVYGAMKNDLVPAMEKFKPEMIFISAGFDSRVNDPLGRFNLTDKDFADMTQLCVDMANKHCEGRILSMLEGGYNLEGLALATRAHVEALAL